MPTVSKMLGWKLAAHRHDANYDAGFKACNLHGSLVKALTDAASIHSFAVNRGVCAAMQLRQVEGFTRFMSDMKTKL